MSETLSIIRKGDQLAIATELIYLPHDGYRDTGAVWSTGNDVLFRTDNAMRVGEKYPDLKREDNKMKLYIGMLFWGFVTIVMALFFLGLILYARYYYLDLDGKFSPEAPEFVYGMYFALKDNSSLVASILAVSGLGWSYFFKVSTDAPVLDEPQRSAIPPFKPVA